MRKRHDLQQELAFDPRAAAGERYDAQMEMTKSVVPSLGSALYPSDDVRMVIDRISADLLEQEAMVKANNIIPFPRGQKQQARGPQSIFLDDFQILAQGDYFDRPGSLGFDSLRQMVEQTPILNAIVMTRIRQISRFTRPQEKADTPGFVIRHVDDEHQLSTDEAESTRLLTRFVNNCGWEFNPRRRLRLGRDTFTDFCAKAVRDSLTMDSVAIETEMKRDRRQGIDGFYAVDGATIRLCSEEGYRGDDEIYAVQVLQGRVRTLYGYDDLIYVPRNPRTSVMVGRYGLAETELLVRVVTGFLNAMTHNIKGFDDNAIPRGIMHLTGEYSEEDLIAFRRYWNAQVKGINNAWTVPVLASKTPEARAELSKIGMDFNEMYFSKWMTFLTSIACAVYSMSPDEINFESFTTHQSSLSGSDTAEKLSNSTDKGLRPLMAYLESLVSDYIICDYSDKYVFRFSGLDPEDGQRRFEMQKLTLSLNEARAQDGLDAWPDKESGLGDAPINPALLSIWQQAKQANNQPEQDFGQVADEGQPDDGQQGEDEKPDFGSPSKAGDFGGKSIIYSAEEW